MKIVFLGSAQFAVSSLKAILGAGYDISCVVTQPDKAKGRGLHLEGTPVKLAAKAAGIKIYQPKEVNSAQSIELFKKLDPDLFVVIAYGQILAQEVLDIPRLMVINAHASLLPKYRGAAPISWAIINGERETGVTIMKVIRKMDAGPIIAQGKLDIGDSDNECIMEKKLAKLAAELSVNAIKAIKDDNMKLVLQDNVKATYAPKLKKENGLIDWGKSAQEIYNLIRGVCGWPGAFTYYRGKLLKIYESQGLSPEKAILSYEGTVPKGVKPGQILCISKDGILVACGSGAILIKELQVEGKRVMSAQEFILGHKVCIGDIFGKK